MDEQIAKRLRGGDTEALDVVMAQYTKLVWSVCGAILKNRASAEDIEECVADVFVELWRRPWAYKPGKGSLKTYLAVLAKSRALNLSRRLAKTDTEELPEAFCTGDTVNDVLRREENAVLYATLQSLEEPDREIFIRRHVLGQKPGDIALALGLNKRQISNKLYQSRGRLKTMLTELGVTP